ncbi:hypothetical protein U0070_008375 [Myodes glareolus]|uniref:Uncharacterized protein n=1 Tax=Myodes glareolus TaxID=447135 RepID=A0AAW0IYC2_MYOGA
MARSAGFQEGALQLFRAVRWAESAALGEGAPSASGNSEDLKPQLPLQMDYISVPHPKTSRLSSPGPELLLSSD